MNKDEEERWENLIIYGIHATDEEMEEVAPIIGVAILIIIVAALIYFIVK